MRYRALDIALRHRLAPDGVLRAGARLGTVRRERKEGAGGLEAQAQRLGELVEHMSSGPIAEATAEANTQHYELPAGFLELLLGPRLKYSSCLWEPGTTRLAEAEDAMLALTAERAEVEDGMRILDLGCGWGSLTLWLAAQLPAAEITGVSNSTRQREWILARAGERGLRNVRVVTADVNEYTPGATFDRVVSVEMFEHMRNWHELLARIAAWLDPQGKAFVHVFSHRTLPYRFDGTWAAERFFTAGLMPSHDLLLRFQHDLRVERSWAVSGKHYARTLEAWLGRLDERRADALAVLRADGRSHAQAALVVGQWRLFLLATAQMWATRGGSAWHVSHYRLAPR